MIKIYLTFLLFSSTAVFASSPAISSCAGTTAGTQVYDSGLGLMKFCDGTNWMSLMGAENGSCAGTTAGTQRYNSSDGVPQFCDGTNWYNMQYRAGGGSGSSLITSSTTFTSSVAGTHHVLCIGGGGGAGYDNGAGGGSGLVNYAAVSLTSGENVTVTIGTGGAGQSSSATAAGGNGTASSFGAYLTASGGSGSPAHTYGGNGGAGGNGGSGGAEGCGATGGTNGGDGGLESEGSNNPGCAPDVRATGQGASFSSNFSNFSEKVLTAGSGGAWGGLCTDASGVGYGAGGGGGSGNGTVNCPYSGGGGGGLVVDGDTSIKQPFAGSRSGQSGINGACVVECCAPSVVAISSCAGTTAGTQRYSSGDMQFCDGTNWYSMSSNY